MNLFILQLVILFVPGIIWERIDAQYGRNRATSQWDIIRRTFVFGLAAYVITYFGFWLASIVCQGVSFKFFEISDTTPFLDRTAVWQIFITSAVALVGSIVWLYATNRKSLTRFLQWIGATKRYGDEDVWDFTFNSRQAEVEFVNVRDFDKEITYTGWVELFSESEKQRELLLRDVIVYDWSGNEIFKMARVYLARKSDNIDIEFPHREENG